jgi:hypothetical protein
VYIYILEHQNWEEAKKKLVLTTWGLKKENTFGKEGIKPKLSTINMIKRFISISSILQIGQ